MPAGVETRGVCLRDVQAENGLPERDGQAVGRGWFEIGFTPIFWAYASGFPKAMNIGRAVDKRNAKRVNVPEFREYLRSYFDNGKTRADLQALLGNCGGMTRNG